MSDHDAENEDRQNEGSQQEGLDGERPQNPDPVEFTSATPPAEWAIAAVGALLACGIIVLLAVQSINSGDGPPLLSTAVTGVVAASTDGHLVRGSVSNSGGQAASNVQVEGRLYVDGDMVESASAELDYVPAGTDRPFVLLFARDPDDGRLETMATGFTTS